MGYYTVLTPCVVGTLHYARVPSQPILADDDTAAELVAAGALAPYLPGADTDGDTDGDDATVTEVAPARSRRRPRED